MKKVPIFLLILILLCCSSCKINQIKNGQREGLWIEKYDLESVQHKSIGKYRKDEEIKTWKFFKNNKLYRKEIYKNGFCIMTFYHDNGKIASQGKTKVVESPKERHWFYFGDWKFFDTNGKLHTIKKYTNGELISETNVR